MRKYLIVFYRYLLLFGFDPKKFINSSGSIFFYLNDFRKMKKEKGNDKTFLFGPIFPILDERYSESGTMSGHYFHQDLFVAKKIYSENPKRHIDIGSRTDGFVAHVASFRKIEVLDIREQNSIVDNIVFRRGDLMKLPDELTNCCDSISALHSIEHFGLGRYGDPIDYNGHIKAIGNIHKMLLPNGKFYFSVPIGKQRIEFNAHRVFSLKYLIEKLRDYFCIISFSYIDDKGSFFQEVILAPEKIENNFDCTFGCGIFILQKNKLQ